MRLWSVALVAVACSAWSLSLPYVADDFWYFGDLSEMGLSGVVATYWNPFTNRLYRPLIWVHFALLSPSHPLVSHLIAVTVHAANAALVCSLLSTLLDDDALGWFAGILYGSAVYIHHDALFWASGMQDLACLLCAFASIRLWLDQRPRRSVALFLVAALWKEAAIIAPLVCITLAWHRRERTAPMLVAMCGYGALKAANILGTLRPPDDPYALGLVSGDHAARYAAWLLSPFWSEPVSQTLALVAVAFVLAIASTRHSLPLVTWLLLGSCAFLCLPNHIYRYYLSAVLPAWLGLCLLALQRLFPARREWLAVSCLMTLLAGLSTTIVIHTLPTAGATDAYASDGSNELWQHLPTPATTARTQSPPIP